MRFVLFWFVTVAAISAPVYLDGAVKDFCWHVWVSPPCSVWTHRDYYYAQVVREKIEADRLRDIADRTIVVKREWPKPEGIGFSPQTILEIGLWHEARKR